MWVIAHRGASAVAPENTIAAFRRAVELGAGFIETDLQLSRDARLVALHDETLDRTTPSRVGEESCPRPALTPNAARVPSYATRDHGPAQ